MSPYTHTTLAQAKTQLAGRLRDQLKQFWTDGGTYNELGDLIAEALYTWQMLTGYWRDRGVFNTAVGTMLYNLHAELPTLLGYNITTRQSIASVQYRLLEPATPTAWTGSAMFALTDVVTALQNRRNRFLVDTGSVLTPVNLPISPPPASREYLPDNIIDVLRFVWKDVSNVRSSLWRNYEYNATAYDPEWALTPDLPEMFSVLSTPPLTIQVIPPPIDLATMELVTVRAPAVLDPSDAANLINVPDNSEWVVKWGAISDLLLREGESYDQIRGQYAQQRYDHGVKVVTGHRHAFQWEIQGEPVIPSGLMDSDIYEDDWHNVTGVPVELLLIGQNLVATSPIANGIYGITVDVVRNAPIPANDGDFIQLGRQDLDVVLGYAEHLAAFKLGGGEFVATIPLLQSFLKQAQGYNARIVEFNDYALNSIQSIPNIRATATPIAAAMEEAE